jgi:flagellar L-ring protein FlgH
MKNNQSKRSRKAISRGASAGALLAVAFVTPADRAVAQNATLPMSPMAIAQQSAGMSRGNAPKGEPAPGQQPPATLENCSFIYQKAPPESELREMKINDIITVLVDYRAAMESEGDAQNRKQSNYNLTLKDWIRFDGKNIFPDAFNRGEPKIAGNLDSQFRVNSNMDVKDSLTFRIAAYVVDIQPNGNLVIEAHRHIHINEEVWEQSLTGVVRRSAIGPDRTVRSDEVADLRVEKREEGFIRDSYSRGWLQRWYAIWKPF